MKFLKTSFHAIENIAEISILIILAAAPIPFFGMRHDSQLLSHFLFGLWGFTLCMYFVWRRLKSEEQLKKIREFIGEEPQFVEDEEEVHGGIKIIDRRKTKKRPLVILGEKGEKW